MCNPQTFLWKKKILPTAQLLYIVKHDWRDSLINYERNSHYSEQVLTQFIKHVMHICCKYTDFT